MKKYTALLMFIASLTWACADPITERDQNSRDTLYERMSASVFAVYHSIKNSDISKDEQEKWVHLGANSAFQYWMTTRKGGIRISKDVDNAIAYFYEDAIESKMKAVFSDPLFRKESDNIGVPGFPKITQEQYKEYVVEFQAYLNEVLKKRQMGEKKNSKE